MKTTVDIPRPLLETAKRVARERKTTLRALVEAGLRFVVGRGGRGARYRYRPVVVDGRGLQPGVREGGWDLVRQMVYEGRGG
jgi:hypothetical protein